MTNKIRIAKPGYNALTETNLDNIVYDSDYDTLKYYSSGSTSLSVNGANIETTVTHNLGYVPFFIVYSNIPTNSSRYSMCPFVFADFGVYCYIDTYADSTKLYFSVTTDSTVATITFLYKIFRNSTGL
jgi:hypothetical protein